MSRQIAQVGRTRAEIIETREGEIILKLHAPRLTSRESHNERRIILHGEHGPDLLAALS
jgi:hypothetical protein